MPDTLRLTGVWGVPLLRGHTVPDFPTVGIPAVVGSGASAAPAGMARLPGSVVTRAARTAALPEGREHLLRGVVRRRRRRGGCTVPAAR
ncbi:hypothetical protein ACPCTO_13535 [Streptomyces olivoreticuli]